MADDAEHDAIAAFAVGEPGDWSRPSAYLPESASKVGSIRQANQGVFSILPADDGSDTTEPNEAGGGSFIADGSPMKPVHIVTTVQYYPDK